MIIANLASEFLVGTVQSEIDPDLCSVSVLPCEELQEEYSVMTSEVKIASKEVNILCTVHTNISDTKLYFGNIKIVNACTSRFIYVSCINLLFPEVWTLQSFEEVLTSSSVLEFIKLIACKYG